MRGIRSAGGAMRAPSLALPRRQERPTGERTFSRTAFLVPSPFTNHFTQSPITNHQSLNEQERMHPLQPAHVVQIAVEVRHFGDADTLRELAAKRIHAHHIPAREDLVAFEVLEQSPRAGFVVE